MRNGIIHACNIKRKKMFKFICNSEFWSVKGRLLDLSVFAHVGT